MKMQRAFPAEYTFVPKTWLLPAEITDFRNSNSNPGNTAGRNMKQTFIIKPEGLSQGKGIHLCRDIDEIIENSI